MEIEEDGRVWSGWATPGQAVLSNNGRILTVGGNTVYQRFNSQGPDVAGVWYNTPDEELLWLRPDGTMVSGLMEDAVSYFGRYSWENGIYITWELRSLINTHKNCIQWRSFSHLPYETKYKIKNDRLAVTLGEKTEVWQHIPKI